MHYGGYLTEERPGVPFVHCLEMVLVAMDYQVRSLMLILQLSVCQNAGELEYAILKRIEATHF
jgi:hypothetical protein